MTPEAQRLKAEIRAKEQQLKKLQDECQHKNKVIKMDDKNSAMWECTTCEKRLTFPTPKEIQKWMNQ